MLNIIYLILLLWMWFRGFLENYFYIKFFIDCSEIVSFLFDYKVNVRILDNSGMKFLSWMIIKMFFVVGIVK